MDGFEVYIQKSMSESDKKICKRFIYESFLARTLADKRRRYFGVNGGGYTSGIWRGRYGIQIDFYPEYKNVSKPIVFRRISKNKRKFACVYSDELVVKNDKYLDKSHSFYRELYPDGEVPDMCLCARHKSSLKVSWRSRRPEMECVAKIY